MDEQKLSLVELELLERNVGSFDCLLYSLKFYISSMKNCFDEEKDFLTIEDYESKRNGALFTIENISSMLDYIKTKLEK